MGRIKGTEIIMIKQGDILAIKTTGEYVYFTGKQFDDGKWEVHRPALTRDGITHKYDSFEVNELETVEDHIKREVTEALLKLQAQKDVMTAKMKALEEESDNRENQVDFSLN
jgi:hypothetical protein